MKDSDNFRYGRSMVGRFIGTLFDSAELINTLALQHVSLAFEAN